VSEKPGIPTWGCYVWLILVIVAIILTFAGVIEPAGVDPSTAPYGF